MKWHEIAVSHPETGHVESFNSIREARTFAKKQDYTPVYIDLYDENGIQDDIRVDVKGARIIP
jgi:hypothetical protein